MPDKFKLGDRVKCFNGHKTLHGTIVYLPLGPMNIHYTVLLDAPLSYNLGLLPNQLCLEEDIFALARALEPEDES